MEQPIGLAAGQAFLDAFTARDWVQFERAFAPDARLRAVVPDDERPFRDRQGGAAAAAQIRVWFEDADVFEVLESSVDAVAERVHVRYRVRLHDADGWSLGEQQLYLTPGPEGIRYCNLVCSGFQPIEPPTQPPADSP